MDVAHTPLGMLMWVLAGLGAAMLVLAFLGFGILALLSVPALVAAVVLNILEDWRLDEAARGPASDAPFRPVR